MTDDTQSTVSNAPQDTNDQNTNNGDTTQTVPSTPPSTPKIDETQFLEDHARTAITEAGGAADLLMPHVLSQLGWRRDGDTLVAFSASGEGAENTKALIDTLKQDHRFKAAFQSTEDSSASVHPSNSSDASPSAETVAIPQSDKAGSGAAPTASFAPSAIKSTDPLALGHAIEEIAAGTTRVNFNL